MGVRTVAFLLLLFPLLLNCTAPPASHGCDGPARDHVMLVDRMRCAGFQVEIAGSVSLPSLRPAGTTLVLSGGGLSGQAELQSFNYDDTDLGTDGRVVSAADARKFAPDGSVLETSQRIDYRGTPHLFRQDRVVVIYAGDDPAVVGILTRLLGKQFAGG